MNAGMLIVLAAGLARAATLTVDTADGKAAWEALRKAKPGDVVVAASAQGSLGIRYGFGPEGLVLTGVLPGSCADQAGLRAGDRVEAVAGVPAAGRTLEEVRPLFGDRRGQRIAFLAGRGGRSLVIEVERGDLSFAISGDLDRARAVMDSGAFPCRDTARWLKPSAKAGDPEAMLRMARVYHEACGETRDAKEALSWARKAAEAGSPEAMTLAAGLVKELKAPGELPPGAQDSWAARGCAAGQARACLLAQSYERAAALGEGEAAFILSQAAHKAGDQDARRRWLRRAALLGQGSARSEFVADFIARPRQGREPEEDLALVRAQARTFPQAARYLGWMYVAGQGVTKDHAEAMRWLLPLAEAGDGEGMTGVGWLLLNGEGVERDPAKALAWFAKAAESRGQCAAQSNLGLMLLYGEGADRNEPEAMKWLKKSAFTYDTSNCYAAKGGECPIPVYNMALVNEHGIYEAKDLGNAARCYEAAKAKDLWSLNRMGEFYLSGGASGFYQDDRKAAEVFRDAARAGDPVAQFHLGELYERGRGVIKDTRQAAVWYKRAAAFSGDPREDRVGPDFAMRLDLRKALPDSAAASGELAAMKKAAALKAEEMRAVPGASASAQSSAVDTPRYRLPERPGDFAVVVGIERYAHLPRADYAERDAQAVRDHLVALGFPARNVVLLKGAEASRASLAKNLETWLPLNVREGSTVFFYFSGHGSPDPRTGKAFLVPADGDAQFLDDTAYPLARLYEKLGALKAGKVLVALDSCFSGMGERSALAQGTRPLVLVAQASDLPPRVTAITASLASEVSGTDDEQGHGLFTTYLLKGLNGEAAGPDGAVTWKRLYEYLQPKVQDEARRVNRQQTPQLQGSAEGVRLR